MEDLIWKVRISVLWLFKIVADLASAIVMLMEKDVIKMIMDGEIYGMVIGPELLFVLAVMLLVPLVMAFLTLTLKGSMNRWANIIVGVVFVGLGLFNFTDPAVHTAHGILMGIALVVAPALIVWYAWKWPKKEG